MNSHHNHTATNDRKNQARPFSRHLKGIFFFLVAVIAVSNITPLLFLDQLIRREEGLVRAQIHRAVNEIRRRWTSSRGEEFTARDLAEVARKHRLSSVRFAIHERSTAGGTWHSWRADVDRHGETIYDTVMTSTPAHPPASHWSAGTLYRSWMIAESWGDRPVTAGGTVEATGLGILTVQMRSERWLRGLLLLGFLAFTVLFYRLVLLPFHDMRRRATALAGSGILPPAPGAQENDPEYVMATFDLLVTRLLEETEHLEARAVHSERHARNVEKFNDYILSSLSTGVVILDRKGKVLRFNRAAETILNLRAADVKGHHFTRTALDKPLVDVLARGLREGQVYGRRELRIDRASDPDPLYLGINTSRIRNDENEIIGLSLLLTDLTTIKKLENEVTENQRLADLGELAAGLAHQLRNSIAAIFGYGKMLQSAKSDGVPKADWVDAIISETGATNEMIARFLDFARPLKGDRTRIGLRDIIVGAIRTVENALVDSSMPEIAPIPEELESMHVSGDNILLKQVFVNLIQNAVEACGPTGRIAISCTAAPASGNEPARWTVAIADNGPGIDEANGARIFHPFFTTKESGTGLGLALARKIVGFHGGTLTLQKSDSSGSTFAVTLAAAPDGVAPGTNAPPELSIRPAPTEPSGPTR